MDSKQRAKLKSQAHSLNAIIQIGKNGVTDETVKVVKNAFNNKELIKIKMIEACPLEGPEAASILAQKTKSEVVQIIGSKIVLYKKDTSKKKKKPVTTSPISREKAKSCNNSSEEKNYKSKSFGGRNNSNSNKGSSRDKNSVGNRASNRGSRGISRLRDKSRSK